MKGEVRHSKLVRRCTELGVPIPKDIQELAEEFYKCVEVYPEDFNYPTPDISINDMKHIVDDFYHTTEDAVVQEILTDNPEWYNESVSSILHLYTHKKGAI